MTIIQESGGLTGTQGGHRYRARLIEGDRWGSSGYYAREVLERDGPTVWPPGTQVYLDHPSASESVDRPERSVRDLAGKITSTPVYEADGLYADVEFYPYVAPIIEAMWGDVGMSIRASGTAETAERDGRTGPVITSLTEGMSVDVVTRAGAGGKLVALLESARVTESLPGGLTGGDLERRLEDAVGIDAMVHDWTDEWVVYRDYTSPDPHLVQQTYTADETGQITLTGTPTPVSRRVTYDAHTLPSTSAGIEESRKEPNMAQIQIDEAEHKRLTETADRVTQMEADLAESVKRAEEAEARVVAAHVATDAAKAEAIISAHPFSALEARGLLADMPADESGRLDVPAFERIVTEAAAVKASESGAGRPDGMGATNTDFSEADLDARLGITKGA